jgi:transposase
MDTRRGCRVALAGVAPLILLSFVLTVGDPTRFGKSRELGPYLGLVPRQRESGNSSPALGISKAGNGFLRQLLVDGRSTSWAIEDQTAIYVDGASKRPREVRPPKAGRNRRRSKTGYSAPSSMDDAVGLRSTPPRRDGS